jgi:hypothetical protein
MLLLQMAPECVCTGSLNMRIPLLSRCFTSREEKGEQGKGDGGIRKVLLPTLQAIPYKKSNLG